MIVTMSIKGKFNYRNIEISDKLFKVFSSGDTPLIKRNVWLDRWEMELQNEEVFNQILQRRGMK